MPQPLNLSYYYGSEAEQYNFYRIPKVLFTDKRYHSVSAEAKVLYGLMLDRMSLSVKNGWLDKENRVYIFFTMEDAMELMGCGHGKAVKLFAELDTAKGIGLIERRKQGQGKPTIIYVKNFVSLSDFQTSENGRSEPPAEPLTSENEKSGFPKIERLDFQKSDANNTDKNKTELNDNDLSYQSSEEAPREVKRRLQKEPDRMDEMERYRELIKSNVDYDTLLQHHPYDEETLEGLVEMMVDVVTSRRQYIRLNQQDYPAEVVKSRFLKLDSYHIEYVLECFKKNTTKIFNIRAYLLTALYHAPETISSYYTAEVNHDFYGSP